MTPTLWFHTTKNIAGSPSNIFTVLFCNAPRANRLYWTTVFKKLNALFIQTNHRLFEIPRLPIKMKDIFHPLNIFRRQFRHAPHFFSAMASIRDFLKEAGCSHGLFFLPLSSLHPSPPLKQ